VNYNEAINYINNTGKFAINLGLQRIKRLCDLSGNPEKDLKVIHVAGTNGKGSTTTFISSVLISQGYRVGIYTSPYIERFTERIKINNDEISENEVARLVTEISSDIEKVELEGMERPTEFEIITACAFKYFREQQVDFVLLEVGLGGRFDATNIVNPLLSVITTISYDHMNILGDTLGKIAFEKAGIIKISRPVVIYPQEKEAMEVLLAEAANKNANVKLVSDMKYEVIQDSVDGINFDVLGNREYKNLKLNMTGSYQVMNALTALKTIETLIEEGVNIEYKAIYEGFASAAWPGRFELIHREPYIVLDGGHNIQGIEVLVSALKRYFPNKKIRIVCGMLRDKEYSKMIEKLTEISTDFIAVRANSPRALSAEELKVVIKAKGKNAEAAGSIQEGVKKALELTEKDEVLVFCGSLYMIGEVRGILKKIFI
jgi:dihydrofolate synthase/folylpolyglutamate synthase